MPGINPRLTSPESQYESSAQENGLLPSAPGWSRSTLATPVAQRLYVVRYRADRRITVRNVAFVTTVASGGNDACEVALFSAGGGRLTTTGSTAGKLNAAAGLQTIAITPISFEPDTVFFVGFVAYTVNVTPPQFLSASFGANTPIFAPALPNTEYGNVDTQASMPSAIAAITVGNVSNLPLIAVKES